ncbi:3-oxoacyl-ACP reductase FabG [Candidatus Sneabacter namystus]|uniref:3-oxoacyl-[acyl-carrier-protein] reductase n=1 Tax=Candidatus Sneabacter namystus TaxID=2601646 RepID=A0A5C0UJK4_9RICK|nr:3-oxoacyl-ACP reductase FabG [Candidatus Sneabacter namystus]QEK39791.1 3-oxoacyl-ACP reductase FabG [Candidatus Sneabacter namystus]
MLSLNENSVALVTGASGSIGRAIALGLHKAGAHVVISGTNKDKLEKLGQELKNNYEIQVCDLRDIDACSALIESIPNLGILVCNAGITDDGLAIRMSDETFHKVISVNLESNFALNRQAIKSMFKRRFGRIINVASVVAISGNKGQVNYCASKAGLIGMTKSIALEVASRGITVNSVAPGFILSNMTEKLPQEYKAEIMKKIPQGRFGMPEEIANAVLYLSSTEASYITGQTLHINGGMLMI